jgi:peptidyl-prolyl cis-trans isomerase B (cyclophilin B)
MHRTLQVLSLTAGLVALFAALACQASGPAQSSKETDDVAIAAIDAFIAEKNIDKSASGWKTRLPKPPEVVFDSGKTYFWHLDTNVGSIKIKLMPDVAPMHVSSTIYLTRLGFYDDVPFHRVITGFMAQGGDPLGRGTGGPGYKYAGEFDSKVRHDKPGLLSMANAGPGTDGSQFFLTFVKTPHLDDRHTIFGEVVEGMGTVKELEKRGSRSGRPSEPMKIESAKITVE